MKKLLLSTVVFSFLVFLIPCVDAAMLFDCGLACWLHCDPESPNYQSTFCATCGALCGNGGGSMAYYDTTGCKDTCYINSVSYCVDFNTNNVFCGSCTNNCLAQGGAKCRDVGDNTWDDEIGMSSMRNHVKYFRSSCSGGNCQTPVVTSTVNCGNTKYCYPPPIGIAARCENCPSGFGNCDLIGMNGCEVNLNTNNNNCGSCGNNCGTNGWINSPVCQSDDVYQDYRTYSCSAGSCSNSVALTLKTDCTGATPHCYNGGCAVCNMASHCGTNGWTGTAYCSGNAVYQNYITYSCTSGTCSSSTSPQIKDNCNLYPGYTCSGGLCNAPTDSCDPAIGCGACGSCLVNASRGNAKDCFFKSSGTVCRTAVNDCDAGEICSGSSFDCPADAKYPSGTECGDGLCNECNGTGTCVSMNNVFDTKGEMTCDGTCRICSSGNCGYQAANTNAFGQCSGGISCSGQARLDMSKCSGSGSCGYSLGSCTGGENSMCLFGSCQNFCDDELDNDGDGYADGCDTDCGRQCLSGTCCDTRTCRYRTGDYCGICETCTGSSENCSQVGWGSDPHNDCTTGAFGSATACKAEFCGSGVCRALAAGTACSSATGCRNGGVCDGSSYSCPLGSPKASGTECGTQSCLQCDGAGNCAGMNNVQDSTGSYRCDSACNVCLFGSCDYQNDWDDFFNRCSGGSSCIGQDVFNYDYCSSTSGGCGVYDYSCGGGENSRCISGVCQNLCSDGIDNDGDGVKDSCDTDCGLWQCSSGACCDASTCRFRRNDYVCASATSCKNAATCSGSATCPAQTNKADSTDCGQCYQCISGTCTAMNNVKDNTAPNTCNGFCQKCSTGTCIDQDYEDYFNECANTYSCTGIIDIIFNGYCNGGGGCGVWTDSCTGSENHYCESGSGVCNNGCSDGKDNDGDSRIDSCDPDCPAYQCNAGACCDLATCRLKTAGSVCSSGDDCKNSASCTGSSTSCPSATNKASGTECGDGLCNECDGAGNCRNVANNQQDFTGIQQCKDTCKTCFGGNCINQPAGNDYFNQCTDSFSCSAQTIWNNGVCSGSGTCGLSPATCGGGENSRCTGGFATCQNLCSDGIDNDGDGYTDGQDPDCGGYGQCNSGGCCNTANGQIRPSGYDGCGTCQQCNGISANCVNAPSGSDPMADCIGNCDSCNGAGSCAPNNAVCSGNCDVCSGSGVNYNCVADSSSCTGNCDVCSGGGTTFNCAASSGLCSGNCAVCSGSGTSFNCGAGSCSGTSASCACQGGGTTFSCSVCTSPSFCSAGSCVGCVNAAQCNDSNPCTVDSCSGGFCSNVAGNPGTVCRASSGACDVAEYCSGSSTSCPSDSKAVVGTDCGGFCQSCDGLGTCVDTGSSNDYQNECNTGFVSCSGSCQRNDYTGNCNGVGACGIVLSNVASGSLCSGGSVQALSCGTFCSTGSNFCSGNALVRNVYGCNGAGGCGTSALQCTVAPLGCAACTVNANCTAIPATTCSGNSVRTYSGLCSSYTCSYPFTDTPCLSPTPYCSAGSCVQCTSAAQCSTPATTCSGNNVRTFTATCSGGVCGSSYVDTACSGSTPYCNAGSCVQCVNSGQCTAIPAPTCNGNSVRTYFGSCSGFTCSYPFTDTACSGGTPYCSGGSCVQCTSPAHCNDGNLCTQDLCNAGVCSNPAGNAGTVCRASVGDCDRQEVCSGSSTSCPSDSKYGPSDDVCLPCQYCTGSSNDCSNTPSGSDYFTDCIGNCDSCNGAGSCAPNNAVCSGNCDVCSGSGVNYNCVADSSSCTGNCDVCSGGGTTFNCAASSGLCSGNCAVCSGSGTSFNCGAGSCSGTSASCACQGFGTSYSCSVCTSPSFCSAGSCVGCTADSQCNDTNPCTQDRCISGSCNYATPSSSSTLCRSSTGTCDVTEYCTGSSTVCPSDSKAVVGTDCVGFCQSCDGLGNCVNTANNQDYQNECNPSFTSCIDSCRRSGVGDFCNGVGGCGTQTANIASGSICTGAGVQSAVGCGTYCSFGSNYCSGNDLVRNVYGCNGAGGCGTSALQCTVTPLGCAACTVNANCTAIPAADCPDATHRRTYSGLCTAFTCSYPGTITACSAPTPYCNAGSCVQCTDSGQCTAIPATTCSGNSVRAFYGMCAGNTCSYPFTDTPCVSPTPYCSGNSCVQCTLASQCSVPPSTCIGNSVRTFSATCSGGTCGSSFVDTACSGGTPYCSGGSCVQCTSPAHCNDGNLCTQDLCNAGVCSNPAGNAGTVCRASVGDCDRREVCSGSSTSCPSDSKYGPSDDVCLPCQYCTGSSNDCSNTPSGSDYFTDCIGNCDSCNGAGSCAPNNAACTGNCDVCSGSGVNYNCAANPGSCSGGCAVCSGGGTSFSCGPNDAICSGNCDYCAFSGGQYNCAANNSLCSGTSGSCSCQPIAGGYSCSVCSAPSFCSGGSCVGCTADSQCVDANPCTLNRCIGGLCNYTLPAASTELCRASSGVCDPAEYCTGSSTVCPANLTAPVGTNCPGICMSCNFLGQCDYDPPGHDYNNDCSGGFNSCSDSCLLEGPTGFCDGYGDCEVGGNLSFVSVGKVCFNGLEFPVNCTNACSFSGSSCSFPNLVRTTYGCDGTGFCGSPVSQCVFTPLGCAQCIDNSGCTNIPNATCLNSTVITTYSGVCLNYNCTYPGTNSECAGGQTCSIQGSSAVCSSHCGNGVFEPLYGEECDDHNLIDGDGCDGSCRMTGCAPCAVSITPSLGCTGRVCSMNDILNVGFSIIGASCQKPDGVQIDYYTADGSCKIDGSGVHINGIKNTFVGAANITACTALAGYSPFNYTMPSIPDACAGKNVTRIAVGLYSNNFTVFRSDIYYLATNPGIVLDQCSQFGNVLAYKNLTFQAIYRNDSCITHTCNDYDAVPVIPNTTAFGVHLYNKTSASYRYYQCGAADGLCPDDFLYNNACGINGVCFNNSAFDVDCMTPIQMKCGMTWNTSGNNNVSTCIVPTVAGQPLSYGCPNSSSCVYGNELTGANPACYNVGEIRLNKDGRAIECMNTQNYWCPRGFRYDQGFKACTKAQGECYTRGCTELDYIGYLTSVPNVTNTLNYTKWMSYLKNTNCFTENTATTRRSRYCAMISDWPIPIYGWSDVGVVFKLSNGTKYNTSKGRGGDLIITPGGDNEPDPVVYGGGDNEDNFVN